MYTDCAAQACPASNGVKCSSNGSVFQITCNLEYAVAPLDSVCATTIGECTNLCSNKYKGKCVGVNFQPLGNVGCAINFLGLVASSNCFILGAATGGHGTIGTLSALKLS
jgi:hypothetical protein